MLKKLLNNHFFRGSFIVTASSFIVGLLNWGFNVIIAKNLSLGDYGEYSSVIAYTIIFTIPFGAFGAILIRKLGTIPVHDRRAYGLEIEKWLYAKLLRNLLLLLLFGAVGYFFLQNRSNLQTISVLYLLPMVLVILLQTVYISAFQAYKAFWVYGIYLIVASTLRLLGGFTIVHFFPALGPLYVALFVLGIFQVLSGHFLMGRSVTHKHPKLVFPRVWTYLKKRMIYIPLLATLGLLGIANMDIILVKKLMTSSDAGLYSATSLLAKIILYLISPIISVGYIFFTGEENKHQANQIFALICCGIISIGVAVILFYTLFGEFAIHLFYTQQYLSIKNILWLGGIYGTLYSLVTVFSYYFVAKNSWFSLASLFCLVAQMVSIFFFHHSLQEVLIVNNVALGVLVIAYAVGFVINGRGGKPTALAQPAV